MAQSAVDKALNKFSTPACPTMTGNVLIPKFVVICYLVISPQVLPCNEINFVILPYKMACRVARGVCKTGKISFLVAVNIAVGRKFEKITLACAPCLLLRFSYLLPRHYARSAFQKDFSPRDEMPGE